MIPSHPNSPGAYQPQAGPRRLPPLSDVVASALGDTDWEVPFSNERLELLLRHIEAGYPLRVACGMCGLDESAYDRWRHFCPDISRAIDVAVEIARAPAIEAILAKARCGDSRAWATWLRYFHKGVSAPPKCALSAPNAPSISSMADSKNGAALISGIVV